MVFVATEIPIKDWFLDSLWRDLCGFVHWSWKLPIRKEYNLAMTVNIHQSYSVIIKFVLFVRGHELGTDLGALEVFSKCFATILFLYNLPFDILGVDMSQVHQTSSQTEYWFLPFYILFLGIGSHCGDQASLKCMEIDLPASSSGVLGLMTYATILSS